MDQLICASLFPHPLQYWHVVYMCDSAGIGGTKTILKYIHKPTSLLITADTPHAWGKNTCQEYDTVLFMHY